MTTALEHCYVTKPVTKGLINNVGLSLICDHAFNYHEKMISAKGKPKLVRGLGDLFLKKQLPKPCFGTF